MKKIISIIILIILVLLVWNIVNKPKEQGLQKTNNESVSENTPIPNENIINQASSTKITSPLSKDLKIYKISEVTLHDKAGDCWTAINNNVYDLTTWPEKHPGGDKAIFAICGIDGTVNYEKAHKGQENPTKVLESFLIGKLEK